MPIVATPASGGAYGNYSEVVGTKTYKRSVSLGNVSPSLIAPDSANQSIYDIVVALNPCIGLTPAGVGIEKRVTSNLVNET